jgi:hypothetical protein
MNNIDHYVGGQFAWFTGVVEDIHDPLEMGRVKVRCFGYHSPDLAAISTESLPWAMVMTPITSASMTGIGQSATGVLQGSWVVGFFRDGPSAQDPIVLGTIPSMSTDKRPDSGFSDPDRVYPREEGLEKPDTPIQSRSDWTEANSYAKREEIHVSNIETAVPPRVSTVAQDESDSYYNRQTWSNWEIAEQVQPTYPMNHSIETESGHVREIDDTPDYGRIFEMHRSGTYYEINNEGDRTLTVVGDNYTVIFGSNNVYIRGLCNLTIDGDLRTLVKGNYHLEVEGNKTEYIKGSRQSKIGQSENIEIGKDVSKNTTGNHIERVGGNATITIDGYRLETIGSNDDRTIGGNHSQIVVGNSQYAVGGNLEVSVLGHLYLTSQEEMKMETPSDMEMNVDGNQTMTIAGTQDITASVTNINNNVNIDGNLDVTGTIDADGVITSGTQVKVGAINLTTHRHTGVMSGLATTATPVA